MAKSTDGDVQLPPNVSIRGARQNNLKNVDVDIPRDKFVVFTGISGSGKSSLMVRRNKLLKCITAPQLRF